MNLSEFECKIKCFLKKLAENVLLPTWRTLLLLYEENCALKDIIIKKDVEIEQYKVEGAVLKRSMYSSIGVAYRESLTIPFMFNYKVW